jgi:outer membrane protein
MYQHPWPTLIAILSLCALLSGCRVDQAKEVATYRTILDQNPTTQPFVEGEPLTLERALELANQHNERLGLAGEDYVQALIDKKRAVAAFLPTISLEPTHFRQDPGGQTADNDSDSPNRGSTFRKTRTDVPVTGSMNLFRGFGDVAGFRAAARTAEQRRALLLDAQATLLLDVAEVYFAILRAEASVEVLKNSLAVQDERLRDTRGRFKAGVARPLDVAQTEAQAAGTRVSLLAAQNDVENGRSVLSFLVGVPAGLSALIDDARPPMEVAELEELQRIAEERRQDLAAARSAIDAAGQNVRAAISQYYPSITIDLNYFLSRESTPEESKWNALLRANLPIFSAGLIEADVREAWSFLRQAKLGESLIRRQIVQEVEIARQTLLLSRRRLAELQLQLEAAAEALRQAEASYKAGLVTNLERLTAQDALLNTQLQIAGERFDQKLFYLSLLRATGELSTRLPGESTTRPVEER